MSKYDRYRKENESISNEIVQKTRESQAISLKIENEAKRVSNVIDKVNIIVGDADTQFEKATGLKGQDITLLFVAVALQCARQYLIGHITQRTNDQVAAKNTPGYNDNRHSDRQHRWYNPSIQEIMDNPEPFDAIFGSKDFDLGIGGGLNHRVSTLGHDPLLGWIFGTANIATSTLTTSELRTFHVLTGTTANGAARDKISYNASTFKMLDYTKNKLLHEGMEGKEKIGLSIMREAMHLRSDIGSTKSLPIPVVSTFSVKAARDLAGFGIDMGNIVKVFGQAGFAVLINSLIGMFHGLFYDEAVHGSRTVYAVKTRKILSYSNLIASASNVIVVAIAAVTGAKTGVGAKKALSYLDIGGIIVTIHRIITDRKFITEIKKEFIEDIWQKAVLGE